MDEYLKKEVLIEDFKSCGANKDIVDAIIYRINQHQPADVVEVRHGKWIEKPNPWGQDGSHTYICSICNEQISILGNLLPYCPNCGAKMDEEIK